MATYPGAVNAMRSVLETGWSTTPIAYQNLDFDPPTDPITGLPGPWVFFETRSTRSEMRAINIPGNHEWITYGFIYVHVFVPIDSGIDLGIGYAQTIGELYRNKQFYDSDPGACVRTRVPRIDGGGTSDDEGNWFRVSVECDFEFFFRG